MRWGSPEESCGVSGSGVGDMIACPARLALPQAREPAGDPAARGNIIHEFARTTTVNPAARAQALLDIEDPAIRATCAQLNLDEALFGLTVLGCEVAYALNVETRTVRLIGTNIGRDYNGALTRAGKPRLSRYEVPFTVDVEAMAVTVPVELDYKTGQSIGPVAEHWQRRTCASGLIYLHDAPTAISRVAYIREDGTVYPDGHEFSVLDAEDFCDEIKAGIDAVWRARALIEQGIMPTVNADREKQCTYCNAFNSCPYWTNLIKGAADKLKGIDDVEALAATDAAKVFDYVKDVMKVAKAMEDKLKERVYKEPLPLDEKSEFRVESKSGRSYFDDSAARGLLVVMMAKAGLSEDEITEKMAALTKQGAQVQEVRKRKRLPMAAQGEEKNV